MSKYQGASDQANKADNIIAVVREYDEEKQKEGISGRIQVIKNRYWSELPTVNTHYDTETKMLLEVEGETSEYIAYSFGFEKFLPEDSGVDWDALAKAIRLED